MAIKSNKKIDFEYEFESPNGSSYSISLRFFHTEEYGATIAVLDEEGEPAINFPVTMFSEVSAFLVEQGILEGSKKLSVPQVPIKLPKTTTIPSKPSLSLPKPKLVSPKISSVTKTTNRDVVEVNLEDDNGEDLLDVPDDMKDMLLKEKSRLENIQSGIEGQVAVHSLSNSAGEQVSLSEDEMQRLMQERQSSVNRAKASSSHKSIKKIDR